jgi:beta-1,4-mannosyltransferase
MRTAVIVLGDLGRSPRMQYHAVSLAAAGAEVDLVGLEGAPVVPAVSVNARIRCHRLPDRAFAGRRKGGVRRYVWSSVFRAFGQASRLFGTLLRLPRPDVILVQNPPAVPTLAIAWLAARLRGSRVVIDWHNLSHTIAAVHLGEHHRAVKAIKRSEKRWAKRADGHLAVSQALAGWLSREFKVTPAVVYDRPAASFAPPSPAAASALWARLAAEHHLGPTRPPIIVCPTSWSPDEDFDLVLEALERAERQLSKIRGDKPFLSADARSAKVEGLSVPDLVVFLTGRGPLRETFEQRAARRNFKVIAVKTVWLEPADYPTLVGMADLGLCLHQSASGLDLPMKLADLRGAGVPVATYDYAPVLGEVMTSGHEGVTFRDPGELANILVGVATHSMAESALSKSRSWLTQHPPERWEAQWDRAAKPQLMIS